MSWKTNIVVPFSLCSSILQYCTLQSLSVSASSLLNATLCDGTKAFPTSESRKTMKSLIQRTNHSLISTNKGAFSIITTVFSLEIVVAMYAANNIPTTKLYSCTCIYKMRYDHLSDKVEERRSRLGKVTSSGYCREKSRYQPEKPKVRNMGNGNIRGPRSYETGPRSYETKVYIIWVEDGSW